MPPSVWTTWMVEQGLSRMRRPVGTAVPIPIGLAGPPRGSVPYPSANSLLQYLDHSSVRKHSSPGEFCIRLPKLSSRFHANQPGFDVRHISYVIGPGCCAYNLHIRSVTFFRYRHILNGPILRCLRQAVLSPPTLGSRTP